MNLLTLIRRWWTGGLSDAEALIDHAPVENKRKRHIHTRKLKEAAQKYGREFKCAADNIPHEVLRREKSATVTPISTRHATKRS